MEVTHHWKGFFFFTDISLPLMLWAPSWVIQVIHPTCMLRSLDPVIIWVSTLKHKIECGVDVVSTFIIVKPSGLRIMWSLKVLQILNFHEKVDAKICVHEWIKHGCRSSLKLHDPSNQKPAKSQWLISEVKSQSYNYLVISHPIWKNKQWNQSQRHEAEMPAGNWRLSFPWQWLFTKE